MCVRSSSSSTFAFCVISHLSRRTRETVREINRFDSSFVLIRGEVLRVKEEEEEEVIILKKKKSE